MGALRSCESGLCPLTANPTRGAIVGAILGLLVAWTMLLSHTTRKEASERADRADSKVLVVSDEEIFRKDVLGSDRLSIVIFSSLNCSACHRYQPIYEALAQEMDSILVAKVDVDRQPNLAAPYRLRFLPTTLLLKEGKEVGRLEGVIQKETLRRTIEKALTS